MSDCGRTNRVPVTIWFKIVCTLCDKFSSFSLVGFLNRKSHAGNAVKYIMFGLKTLQRTKLKDIHLLKRDKIELVLTDRGKFLIMHRCHPGVLKQEHVAKLQQHIRQSQAIAQKGSI